MRGIYKVLLTLFVLVAASLCVFAQTDTGEISGTVTDKSGAVVSGATVTATNPATGFSRSVTTGSNGAYTISNLRPANYDVKVEGAGFKAIVRKVALNVGGHQTADIAMDVAAESTTVDVIAGSGVEVNTQNAELSQVVTETQVKELPT